MTPTLAPITLARRLRELDETLARMAAEHTEGRVGFICTQLHPCDLLDPRDYLDMGDLDADALAEMQAGLGETTP